MTDIVALALGAALAVACVLLAARPFLRHPAARGDALPEPAAADDERRALQEVRDRALEALKELEFDHRTGKISDDDYRELLGPLRQEVGEALRALDGRRQAPGAPTGRMESPPEPARVPEPWPPPDEGDLPGPPTPSPGEPTPGPEEPAPPKQPPVPEMRE